jgi:peptidylprolyl isomerase
LPLFFWQPLSTSHFRSIKISLSFLSLSLSLFLSLSLSTPNHHRHHSFKKEMKKRKIPESDYVESEECGGLRVYEVRGGEAGGSSSQRIQAGDTVTVHFDVLYRGLDVASSRSARLLGANRTIAEPYSFVAGGAVRALSPKRAGESGGGGLYSGAGGPEPPPALSDAVLGMRVGGIRSALVPPERGYGQRGLGEIPAGASFELRVEVLEIKKKDK